MFSDGQHGCLIHHLFFFFFFFFFFSSKSSFPSSSTFITFSILLFHPSSHLIIHLFSTFIIFLPFGSVHFVYLAPTHRKTQLKALYRLIKVHLNTVQFILVQFHSFLHLLFYLFFPLLHLPSISVVPPLLCQRSVAQLSLSNWDTHTNTQQMIRLASHLLPTMLFHHTDHDTHTS